MKRAMFYSVLILLLCSLRCKNGGEEPTPQKPYDIRDQFVGFYSVKSDSGNTYGMKISKFDSAGKKYLLINNLANLFTEIRSTYDGFFKPLNYFYLEENYGIKDKFGRTWDIGGYNDDTTTSVRENVLVNNQIIIYYRLQNMPWWNAEGVPYHYAFHKHIATKIY